MELKSPRGVQCSHPFTIGDDFIRNCKLCGLYLTRVSDSVVKGGRAGNGR